MCVWELGREGRTGKDEEGERENEKERDERGNSDEELERERSREGGKERIYGILFNSWA